MHVAVCTDITIFLLRVERRTNNEYSSRALPKVIINRSCAMTMKKECQGNDVDSSSSFAFSKFTGSATKHVNSFSSTIEAQARNTIAVDAIGNINIKIM